MPGTLPTSFLRPDLEGVGFVGWLTWDELRADAFEPIPRPAATYLVYRPAADPPRFVGVGTGGHFKGRDPNVAIATLEAAHTVYVGKADKLRRRLNVAPAREDERGLLGTSWRSTTAGGRSPT